MDQHNLLTVVPSHPHTVKEVHVDPRKRPEVDRREELTVNWLRELYGDTLVSVVRHEDETYQHLDAYILPPSQDLKAAIDGMEGIRACGDRFRWQPYSGSVLLALIGSVLLSGLFVLAFQYLVLLPYVIAVWPKANRQLQAFFDDFAAW
ncbi:MULTISPECIES: hypothetical protein [Rhizobium]|uniref:hypothetical protein n=1 Tax=Rhizobium TaxID=379 RepID=UPI0011411E72|nr:MULTISPECIES: hypothetical protein [Rhizobium]WET73554.1 hypothetical protein PYR68_19315 [Rhizobium croatiense]